MTPVEMLRQLNVHGENAGSDYNDSDAVHGRFGWTADPDVSRGTFATLTVTHEDQDVDPATPITKQWCLIPVANISTATTP